MLINRITNINSNEFSTAMQIYENSFPDNERQSIETISNRVQSGYEELYCFMKSHELIGIALIRDLNFDDFCLLDYFAVAENNRGSGAGTFFITEIINNNKSRKILLEVEKYNTEINDIKKRRAKFYFRCGCKEIVGFNYIMPSIDGGLPEAMCLMLANYRYESIRLETLNKLCTEIYSQIFSTDYFPRNDNLELEYNIISYLK